jgi:lipoate-protein ligase B
LADLGVEAEGGRRERGVWVGPRKVAAVGVAIRGGISMHGYALNLQPNLAHFSLIRPCGMLSDRITSLAELGRGPVAARVAASRLAEAFGSVFEREMIEVSAPRLDSLLPPADRAQIAVPEARQSTGRPTGTMGEGS